MDGIKIETKANSHTEGYGIRNAKNHLRNTPMRADPAGFPATVPAGSSS